MPRMKTSLGDGGQYDPERILLNFERTKHQRVTKFYPETETHWPFWMVSTGVSHYFIVFRKDTKRFGRIKSEEYAAKRGAHDFELPPELWFTEDDEQLLKMAYTVQKKLNLWKKDPRKRTS